MKGLKLLSVLFLLSALSCSAFKNVNQIHQFETEDPLWAPYQEYCEGNFDDGNKLLDELIDQNPGYASAVLLRRFYEPSERTETVERVTEKIKKEGTFEGPVERLEAAAALYYSRSDNFSKVQSLLRFKSSQTDTEARRLSLKTWFGSCLDKEINEKEAFAHLEQVFLSLPYIDTHILSTLICGTTKVPELKDRRKDFAVYVNALPEWHPQRKTLQALLLDLSDPRPAKGTEQRDEIRRLRKEAYESCPTDLSLRLRYAIEEGYYHGHPSTVLSLLSEVPQNYKFYGVNVDYQLAIAYCQTGNNEKMQQYVEKSLKASDYFREAEITYLQKLRKRGKEIEERKLSRKKSGKANMCDALSEGRDFVSDAQDARKMSAKQAQVLEDTLKKNPRDIEKRLKLLWYYLVEWKSASDKKPSPQRYDHIAWIFRHCPRSEYRSHYQLQLAKEWDSSSYEKGRLLWLELVSQYPEDTKVLMNAYLFFARDDLDLAVKMLETGQRLEPKNSEWEEELGWLYNRHEKFALAYAHYVKALSLESSRIKRFYQLDHVAEAARQAGKPKEAERYAKKLLSEAPNFKEDWNYGNAIHDGNIILGMLALEKKKIRKASKYLKKAGLTPGSPQLDSFGPDLVLADELLRRKKRKEVVEYLRNCQKFWEMDRGVLEKWIGEIEAGETPTLDKRKAYEEKKK